MKYLDNIFDLVYYTFILTCFIAAGASVIQTVATGERLLTSIALFSMGVAGSWFFIHVKQQDRTHVNDKQ